MDGGRKFITTRAQDEWCARPTFDQKPSHKYRFRIKHKYKFKHRYKYNYKYKCRLQVDANRARVPWKSQLQISKIFFNPEVDLKRFTNFGGEGVTLIMCQRHEVVV